MGKQNRDSQPLLVRCSIRGQSIGGSRAMVCCALCCDACAVLRYCVIVVVSFLFFSFVFVGVFLSSAVPCCCAVLYYSILCRSAVLLRRGVC